MGEKQVIAVVGATGMQGGGLVRAILANPASGLAVRALTRDEINRALFGVEQTIDGAEHFGFVGIVRDLTAPVHFESDLTIACYARVLGVNRVGDGVNETIGECPITVRLHVGK